MNRKSSRKRRLAKGLILACIMALVSVFALEVLVRVFLPAPLFHNIDILSYGATYMLSDDPNLIYVPKPDTGGFNSYGHRGPAFPFERGEKKRVVFMGDSVVEGFRAMTGKRFSDLLNQGLGDRYEFINLGVRGYDLLQSVEYYRKLGRKFSPDIVFFGITFNDLTVNSGEIVKLNKIMKKRRDSGLYVRYYSMMGDFEKFLLRSHLYRYARLLFTGSGETNMEEVLQSRITDEKIRLALKDVKAIARGAGEKLIFLFMPVNTEFGARDTKRLRDLLIDAGIETMDLDLVISGKHGPGSKEKLFYPRDPCHLNLDGHREVARILKGNLLEMEAGGEGP